MAPSPAPRSSSTPQSHPNGSRTPTTPKFKAVHLAHRFPHPSTPLPPLPPSDHPVEVVGRIREHPDGADAPSVLHVLQNGHTVRVKTEQGYREFALDGVSCAESEDLQSFYKKYVERRIESVKAGGKCTIMMYGPTGAGKSHTMFGSVKEPGIIYRALQNILSGFNAGAGREDAKCPNGSPGFSVGRIRINVTILEIYNEEIFDMLASGPSTPNGHWARPNVCRVRLEVMGKKAKNSVSISGTDAEKISREIAKVEKRLVVKSTSCNDRSSRSHCMVTLDVPTVGGRLVLVDMAGSENLEQAGLGSDSKLQTGKINQGNVALRRVVEAIANGDPYVPFRDSKLTMLLQDSFEDDGAKILMILCASPDPRDMYKTIGTLEYGSKAKCIVRLPVSPAKDKSARTDDLEPSILEARIRAMDSYISKLQAENKNKDREKEEADRELMQKEQDLLDLRRMLEMTEQEWREKCEVHSKKYDEAFVYEVEKRLEECQKVADDIIEMGKNKLEEKIKEQQKELDFMRARVEEIEREMGCLLKSSQERPLLGFDTVRKTEGDIIKDLQNVGASALPIKEVAKVGPQPVGEHERNQILPAVDGDMFGNCKIGLEHDCGQMEIQTQTTYAHQPQQYDGMSDFSDGLPSMYIADGTCHSFGNPKSMPDRKPSNQDISSSCPGDSKLPVRECDDSSDIKSSVMSSELCITDDSQPSVSSMCLDSKEYAGHAQNDLDAFDIGVFERNQWLPIIPEDSEGEDEKMSEDEVDHEEVQVRAPCPVGVNGEQFDDLARMDTRMQVLQSQDSALETIDVNTAKVSKFSEDKESLYYSGTKTKERVDTCPLFEDKKHSDERKQCSETAASRRSRIENIFQLCGNHRELATSSFKPTTEPVLSRCLKESSNLNQVSEESGLLHSKDGSLMGVPPSSPKGLKFSPICWDLSATKSTRETEISPTQIALSKPKHSMLENTPPCAVVSSLVSPSSASFNVHKSRSPKKLSFAGYSPVPTGVSNKQAAELDADRCEVYVKWETSRDSSGKLFNIIKMKQNATLAELREEIESHISDPKHDFTFLMLRDPSGAPVERCTEAALQVVSLPDCHKQRGSKLACLRPCVSRKSIASLGPLSSMENQICCKSLKQITPPQKPISGFSPLKLNDTLTSCNSNVVGKSNQRLEFSNPSKGALAMISSYR